MLLFTIISSCSKKYIQIFNTNTTNTKYENEYFVYETDTLKVTYSFWANQGVMSFTIFNKLEKPVYIDWKNSSFIYNDNKLNYWIEETQTNISSYYGGYFYKGPLLGPGLIINEGYQNSTVTTIKPEKITFIPPKSNYSRTQFYLLPVNFYKINFGCQASVVSRNDKPKKKTTVYSEEFSINNSPLNFRNYLAFTFSENSQQFFFIDNGFYLSSVKEMDYRHYRGKQLGKEQNGNLKYEKPFIKQTSFYIKIEEEKSIEFRQQFVKFLKKNY